MNRLSLINNLCNEANTIGSIMNALQPTLDSRLNFDLEASMMLGKQKLIIKISLESYYEDEEPMYWYELKLGKEHYKSLMPLDIVDAKWQLLQLQEQAQDNEIATADALKEYMQSVSSE